MRMVRRTVFTREGQQHFGAACPSQRQETLVLVLRSAHYDSPHIQVWAASHVANPTLAAPLRAVVSKVGDAEPARCHGASLQLRGTFGECLPGKMADTQEIASMLFLVCLPFSLGPRCPIF